MISVLRAAEARGLVSELGRQGFLLDDNIDLRSEGLGADYEDSTIAYKLYEAGHVPPHGEIVLDLEALAAAYSKVLETVQPGPQRGKRDQAGTQDLLMSTAPTVKPLFDLNSAIQELLQSVEDGGLVYEPWQIASYVAAVRTKPFVILAGVTGTGKTKLPIMVARLTGGVSDLIPVRPDWTDSADVLGYVDLQGAFRPGRLLEFAKRAAQNPDQHWTCVVDEMNLARVEQYFAEFLSRIEDRNPDPMGGFVSGPLVGMPLRTEDGEWASVGIPPNLAIVGTVNMDETTHGFSRKVLDRAFTIELSDTDLTRWTLRTENPAVAGWPASAWYPRAISLAGLSALTQPETARVQTVVDTLTSINGFLQQAQLQVGYRARDEVALFVLHSLDIASAFLTRDGAAVDPLDLAIHMKVLPRLLGGSGAVRRALLQLLGWARSGKPLVTEEEGQSVLDEWIDLGRPGSLPECRYPRTAARLCIMWERLLSEGYTSYWL